MKSDLGMLRQSFVLAAIGLALGLGACQRAAEAPRVSAAVVLDHVSLARTALAAQQWAIAAEHLRAALSTDPSSLFLHSSLAICATWLDLKDEAIGEFEWIVANAPADSEEAKTARRWLVANRGGTQSASAMPAADDPNRGDSAFHGQVSWGEPGQAPTLLSSQQLFLVGLRDTPTKEFFRTVRTDDNGNYVFTKIPAGSYRLIDSIGSAPKWRLKVTVEQGQDLAMDLTPDNGVQHRDDFQKGK